MHTSVIAEHRHYNGLPSSHILLAKSPLHDVLVAPEDNTWLQLSGVDERVDPTINERIQLHRSMVGWRILDLLISANISHVTVNEIILPLQILDDHLGLSRDPPMTMLEAYIKMCFSNVQRILRNEILNRRCWQLKESASGDPTMQS